MAQDDSTGQLLGDRDAPGERKELAMGPAFGRELAAEDVRTGTYAYQFAGSVGGSSGAVPDVAGQHDGWLGRGDGIGGGIVTAWPASSRGVG
ncbi:hypothetical protein [Georgenia sp. SUBG003]|uniref:hypothetical protein n=1 Tax=Georgenia sp. SUBG003 TaxID=1497974 RepID=UPI003AB8873C